MSTATDNAIDSVNVIASIIAGAPRPDLRLTQRSAHRDPLDRIAAALEAQNVILGRLAEAVAGIAAVAGNAEAKLTELITQLDGLGSFGVWGEEDNEVRP